VIDDTGPGFDPLLFDEGGAFRFGVSTRGPARGRGLSLSSDLARTLGGSIAVGRAPDGGGRVVIDLPRSPRSPRTPRSPGKLGELEERRSA